MILCIYLKEKLGVQRVKLSFTLSQVINKISSYILYLLCVSCPSATEFSAISFYFLPDQAQTHLDHWKVLDELGC